MGNIIDNLHTSDEEKDPRREKIEQLLVDEQNGQVGISLVDLKHGSWLSKNIRPITLIFLTGVFVILSVFDGNLGEFTIGESYIPVYQTLLITVY